MCPAACRALSSEARHAKALKRGAEQAFAGACAATHLVSTTHRARQKCRDGVTVQACGAFNPKPVAQGRKGG